MIIILQSKSGCQLGDSGAEIEQQSWEDDWRGPVGTYKVYQDSEGD